MAFILFLRNDLPIRCGLDDGQHVTFFHNHHFIHANVSDSRPRRSVALPLRGPGALVRLSETLIFTAVIK
jgi:hypothetical protein